MWPVFSGAWSGIFFVGFYFECENMMARNRNAFSYVGVGKSIFSSASGTFCKIKVTVPLCNLPKRRFREMMSEAKRIGIGSRKASTLLNKGGVQRRKSKAVKKFRIMYEIFCC